MGLSLQLLAAVLLGATLVATGTLLGARATGKPSAVAERRLDHLLAVSERRADRYLHHLLADSPSHLMQLEGTSPAPPVAPAVQHIPVDADPAEALAREYVADLNDLGMDAYDDAAFRAAR